MNSVSTLRNMLWFSSGCDTHLTVNAGKVELQKGISKSESIL